MNSGGIPLCFSLIHVYRDFMYLTLSWPLFWLSLFVFLESIHFYTQKFKAGNVMNILYCSYLTFLKWGNSEIVPCPRLQLVRDWELDFSSDFLLFAILHTFIALVIYIINVVVSWNSICPKYTQNFKILVLTDCPNTIPHSFQQYGQSSRVVISGKTTKILIHNSSFRSQNLGYSQHYLSLAIWLPAKSYVPFSSFMNFLKLSQQCVFTGLAFQCLQQ